jgi:hypothetical protein
MPTLEGGYEKHEFAEAVTLSDHWPQLATVPI